MRGKGGERFTTVCLLGDFFSRVGLRRNFVYGMLCTFPGPTFSQTGEGIRLEGEEDDLDGASPAPDMAGLPGSSYGALPSRLPAPPDPASLVLREGLGGGAASHSRRGRDFFPSFASLSLASVPDPSSLFTRETR